MRRALVTNLMAAHAITLVERDVDLMAQGTDGDVALLRRGGCRLGLGKLYRSPGEGG